jgi:transposase
MERRKACASDISRQQFEPIGPLLESVRKRTKPRTVDLHDVFNAVLYVLKSGCQWRMLPEGFPNWPTVHSYFAKWSKPCPDGVSALERALKKSAGEAREKLGRNAMTCFLMAEAQSVMNTDTAEQKGYEAGKKVSGIKRHIGVDTQELPPAIAITTAELTDRNGALEAIDRCRPNLELVESVLVDGGYAGQPFADGVLERIEATVQVVKRNQPHTFAVLPKRWVVERCFAWLEKCRRLWKNCERKLNTSLQTIHLAFLALLLRRS